MDHINLVIPFKFLKLGINEFVIETLAHYQVSVSLIASVCTDFIVEFACTTSKGLVMPEPLVLSRFIQNEFHIAFADYIRIKELLLSPPQRLTVKMVNQMVADIAYVILAEIMPPIQQYVTHSNYPIEKISISVIGADLTAVQLELRYEPLRRPTYKFCHYEPTAVQPIKYTFD